MPNITIYLDDDNYTKFRSLPFSKKEELKKKFKNELNKENER